MKKVVLGGILLVTSLLVNANNETLKFLKQAPATKYEVARVQLELYAFALSKELKDQRMKGTSFEISGFSVKDTDSALNLVAKLEGKAKELTSEQCEKFKRHLGGNKLFNNLSKELWPNLSSEQYKELKEVVGLSIKLISRENDSFNIEC